MATKWPKEVLGKIKNGEETWNSYVSSEIVHHPSGDVCYVTVLVPVIRGGRQVADENGSPATVSEIIVVSPDYQITYRV